MTSTQQQLSFSSLSRLAILALLAGYLTVVPAADSSAIGLGAGTYHDGVCNIDDSTPSNHLTPETAFQIDTVDKLWEVTDCDSADSVVYFKILNDLDATTATYAATSSPIGLSSSVVHSFSGVIDGGGYAVSASMYTPKAALFAHLNNATVSNLVIEGSFTHLTTSGVGAAGLSYLSGGKVSILSVTNSARVIARQGVGGLIGVASGQLLIQNSANTGNVEGFTTIGGLVGSSNAELEIQNSRNIGNVIGGGSGVTLASANYIGGVVGYAYGVATLSNTINLGSVKGYTQVGGLVARADMPLSLINSHNVGAVTGAAHVTGGLVARTYAPVSIESSSNTGQIAGSEAVGGLIGYTDFGVTISDSFNSGEISATAHTVGGLVGVFASQASIARSFNTANVTSARGSSGGLVGIGRNSLGVQNSYNLGDVSGSTGAAAGGLVGAFAYGLVSITSSYAAGSVSAATNVDGLIGSTYSATVATSSAYSTVFTSYADRAISRLGQSSDFYPGFDFDNIWGFAPCGEIQAFPLLRQFGQTATFGSMGCTPTISLDSLLGPGGYSISESVSQAPSDESSPREEAPAPVASYVGPKLEMVPATVVQGAAVEITGTKLESVNEVTIAEVAQEIISVTNTSVKFELAPETPAGVHDLVLRSDFGSLTLQGFIKVKPQINPQDQQVDAQGSLTTKTRLLSKNEDLNLAWMKDSLRKLNPEKVVCTATVALGATQYQRVLARLKAKASCDQVLKNTPGAKIWIQAKATRTRFVDRILITSKP